MGFIRQTWTLTKKTLWITVSRHWLSTLVRALLLPVLFTFFVSYIKNFFLPPSNFGIGTPVPVRSFIDALGVSAGGRDTIAFVDNGFKGGDIADLIDYLAVSIRTAGKTVARLDNDTALLTTCRSSLRGVSACYGAATFHSSPTEGNGGIWNYTLRSDGVFGEKIFVDQHDNDAEIYLQPFQKAIDMAIVNQIGKATNGTIPDTVNEYPFTDQSDQQRADSIRRLFMKAIDNFLGVVFFIGMVGIVYHFTGFMASERELGMSQLIEAMTPNKHRWHTQAARLLSNHLAFDILYAPSWIIIGIILRPIVFTKSSYGIVIGLHLLAGLALSSLSILGGSLFRRSQLSGISVTIVSLVLAVIIQVIGVDSSGIVAILGLLFTPITYTLNIQYMARFEGRDMPTNLLRSAPDSPWGNQGISLWISFIIQIILYPVIGAIIERSLYGTASKARKIHFNLAQTAPAIKLTSFSKHYVPSWWKRRIAPIFGGERVATVVAVNNLSLDVVRGQILVLLGANGSGKSTTLDSIAGLGKITHGEIEIDGTGGLGLCPQKNVLWDELTVYEHVAIFNGLKAMDKRDTKEAIENLVRACDLEHKLNAKAKTLSGGQKRKLQLAMMFTGNSRVCCIDEVSSGLDPLSRRKIWDILLRERGARTLLFTTHFLDEADVLSDHIAILSKGSLKADGSAAELKHKLGGGYRVHVHSVPDAGPYKVPRQDEGTNSKTSSGDIASKKVLNRDTVYELEDSAHAAKFVIDAEEQGVTDYSVHGPSIEDVFLRLAEETRIETIADEKRSTSAKPKTSEADLAAEHFSDEKDRDDGLQLLTGTGTGIAQQTWILFRKRVTVFKRNYIPYICLVIIPVAAAGLITLFLKNFTALSCSPTDQVSRSTSEQLSFETDLDIPVGPPGRISQGVLSALSLGNTSVFHMVDTIEAFNSYIEQRYQNVTPGGVFLGDTPTFAYVGNDGVQSSLLTQNILDSLLSGQLISTQYSGFSIPFAPSAGKTLQGIFYFGLAMCAYPGFFALYPTVERLRKVRALHYSNGIRAAPLWLAYTGFDFIFVLIVSTVAIVIWVAVSNVWYGPGYLWVVFVLYGLTSTLFCYVVSLIVASQLAAFAWAVGIQALLFLIYFVAYLVIQAYSPAYRIDQSILVAHFTIALITPAGNLLRALLLTLNEFSVLCNGGTQRASYPGGIKVYGGPILYLILQSIGLFIILVWWDSGYKPAFMRRRSSSKATAKKDYEDNGSTYDPDIAAEISRTESTQAGLRVEHLHKTFSSVPAVQDITFSIPPSTVFALLGPNGAGKSTTISLVRGDLHPDHHGGDVKVEGISVTQRRAEARRHLGVCPQFDAMDSMTVLEHLNFYARARGVPDVPYNVNNIIKAVGLKPYRDRLAQNLSGGNKRKLSLGIALIGNPAVLLLDEPSSGMDAASKRIMWQTLQAVTKGRSMLITTHSMEEADKLADRVGIMACRMLALGTSSELRGRFGDRWYVHLVLVGAPHVPEEEARRVKSWIEGSVEGAVVEERTWYGQLRFSIPAEGRSIASVFALLEENKGLLGLEYYSISQTTLDQIFLEVVGRHNIVEEGAQTDGETVKKKMKPGFVKRLRRFVQDA